MKKAQPHEIRRRILSSMGAEKTFALLLSVILVVSLCACSSGKTDQTEADTSTTEAENEDPVFQTEGMISFSPMETSGNRISRSLECVLTDKQEAANIQLYAQNTCETQPDGWQLLGDGALFFAGVKKFAEQEQLQSFVYNEDTSIIVSYDPSISFSYTVSVYRESEDGLQILDNVSDYRSLDPGYYLFDIFLNASRDNDYCTCDALFWMRYQ